MPNSDRKYFAASSEFPSLKLDRYYVFEEHMVDRTLEGIFLTSFSSLETEGRNAVDGFKVIAGDLSANGVIHDYLVDLSTDDLAGIRNKIRSR